MAWTTGSLLGVATLLIVVVLFRKPQQHDPQMGQAQGCLMILLIGMLLVDVVFAGEVAFDVGWLLRSMFVLVSLPIIWILLGLIYNSVRFASKKVRRSDGYP